MTAGLRVGIAQWTPDSDPGVNLDTAESALRELGRRACRLFNTAVVYGPST
jgi:hypothetical protein